MRKQDDYPAKLRSGIRVIDDVIDNGGRIVFEFRQSGGRQAVVYALVVERRQSQLSNLTGALRTPRRFASCLNGGQQESPPLRR